MPSVSEQLRRRSVRPLDGSSPTTLDAVPTGTRAVVTHVEDDDTALVRRLCDLGFTPGTEIDVLRRAPLGDPVVYRLRDFEICLRDRQARCIQVEVRA